MKLLKGAAFAAFIMTTACGKFLTPGPDPLTSLSAEDSQTKIITLTESQASKLQKVYGRGDISGTQILSRILPGAKSLKWLVKEMPSPDEEAYQKLKNIGADRTVVVEFDSIVEDRIRASGARVHQRRHYTIQNLTAGAPNDPRYEAGDQYSITNKTYPGNDINVIPVWKEFTGSGKIPFYILDTGVSPEPDLAPNIDMVNSRSFIGNSLFTEDLSEHGTHVSGIACGKGNDGYGMAGLNWNCNLVFHKVAQSYSTGRNTPYQAKLSDEAILSSLYEILKSNRPAVINASWGQYMDDQLLREAINALKEKALFVSAAGNVSNGVHYPCRYGSQGVNNILCVAALAPDNKLWQDSNYGPEVHISTYGERILSTVPGGFRFFPGTSMAAPMVAGAASLIWEGALEYGIELTPIEVKQILIQGARPNPLVKEYVTNAINLDVFGSWTKMKSNYISKIVSISKESLTSQEVVLVNLSPVLHPSLLKSNKFKLQVKNLAGREINVDVNIVDNKTLKFIAPTEPGTYTAALFLNNKTTPVSKSFTVAEPIRPSLVLEEVTATNLESETTIAFVGAFAPDANEVVLSCDGEDEILAYAINEAQRIEVSLPLSSIERICRVFVKREGYLPSLTRDFSIPAVSF